MKIYQVWASEERPSGSFTDKTKAGTYAAAVDSINVLKCYIETVDVDMPAQCKPVVGFVVCMLEDGRAFPAKHVILGDIGHMPRVEGAAGGSGVCAYGYGLTEKEALANAEKLLAEFVEPTAGKQGRTEGAER